MNKSLKTRFALLIGAVAVTAISLSFTFSSTPETTTSTKVEAQQPGTIGGFSIDPK